MSKARGLWVSPTEFVQFGEATRSLTDVIASRERSIDFSALGMYLPNPDPVLKKLGKDIKVYRDLRADAHVGGCIRRRKAAVRALEWKLERGAAPARATASLQSILADLDIYGIVTEALEGALYGYQPLEVMWGMVGGYLVPVDVVGKPAEWFVYGVQNELRLRTRQDWIKGEELPDKKFIVARQDATYDNPYGMSDLSLCFWPTTFKKGGLKFWVAFTEKYGSPWVIGKHPRSATGKETDELLDRLEAMVQDAVAVIPDDSSVTILEAAGKSGSAEVYERLLYFCRSEVSIALLGQNQSTEASSTHASATAGLEVTATIRDGDKGIAESVFNELIRWTWELNFSGARPVFRLQEQEEVDQKLAERDEKLTKAGAKLTPAYFMRAYNLQPGDVAEAAAPGAPAPADFAEGAGRDAPDYADAAAPVLGRQAQPLVDRWLERIRRRVDAAADLQALQDGLLAEFAELDDGELADVMGLAFACADLAGRAEVQDEAQGDA